TTNASAPIPTAQAARREARPPIPAAISAMTSAIGTSRTGRYTIPVTLTKIEAAARKPATVSDGRERPKWGAATVAPPVPRRGRSPGAGVGPRRVAVRAWAPRAPTGPPARRRAVIRRRQHDRLLVLRLGLDCPVDDPAQIEDGDLQDHH